MLTSYVPGLTEHLSPSGEGHSLAHAEKKGLTRSLDGELLCLLGLCPKPCRSGLLSHKLLQRPPLAADAAFPDAVMQAPLPAQARTHSLFLQITQKDSFRGYNAESQFIEGGAEQLS